MKLETMINTVFLVIYVHSKKQNNFL